MAESSVNKFLPDKVVGKTTFLSRVPKRCAITDCNKIVGATEILTHYMTNHNNNMTLQCCEIEPNESVIVMFDPSHLEWRKTTCLGILVYGSENRKYYPAERGLCLHSTFLPNGYEKFNAHLPIFIMACRTSWASYLCDQNAEKQISNESNETEGMLLIWFNSVAVTKHIHCTGTVFDKLFTKSYSTIVRVRNFNESQNPSEFVSKDFNYIRLTHNAIKELSHNFKENVNFEIIIKEYEKE